MCALDHLKWMLCIALLACVSVVAAQNPELRVCRLPPVATPVEQVAPGAESPRVPGAFTLRELSFIAVQQHPVLIRSRAEIESAKGGRVQAALYPNPRFETNNPEFWAGRQSQVNFGFQQDMVTKGKIRLEKAAADQQVRKMEARFALQRIRVLTELRQQYYDTLTARERVVVNEQFVRLSQEALETAQKLVQAGQGSSTDILLITTELERARVNLENARTTLAGEIAQLASIAGTPDVRIENLEGSIFDPLPLFHLEEIRRYLVAQSTHMEIATAEITRNKIKLRREEVDPYPNIRFGPSYAVNTPDNRGQFWLSVCFDIPVWDLNQGEIRQARAELQRSVADMDTTRIELLRQLSETSARHVAARNTAERIRTVILPNAQKAQQLVGEGFQKGLFDVNRVLQARRSLLDVNDDLIDALERAWSTAAELAGMLQREEFP